MPHYVDGYVLVLPRKNLNAYRRMARTAAAVWRDHGALHVVETVGEDLKIGVGRPFPLLLKLKAGETAVFSWIVFKSRAQRDRVNAKVMQDPRLQCMMDPAKTPFDCRRMSYGGFRTIVEV